MEARAEGKGESIGFRNSWVLLLTARFDGVSTSVPPPLARHSSSREFAKSSRRRSTLRPKAANPAMGAQSTALAAFLLLLTLSQGLAARTLVDDMEGAETSGGVTLRSLKANKNKINFKKSGCPDAWGAFRAINALRASRGAAPLKWSARLSLDAQGWANACTFSHSGGGENLMMGLGSCQGAVEWWAGEAAYWAPGMDYNPAAGHFTQLVWKSTTSVGCGYANCPQGPYVVCRFDPPGNVIGQFSWNVQ